MHATKRPFAAGRRAARLEPGATLADLYPDQSPRSRPGETVLVPLADENAVAEFSDAAPARDALVHLERHGYEAESLSFLAVDSHEGDVAVADSDAATMGSAFRRAVVWGGIGGAVGAVLVFAVTLLIGTSIGTAVGVAIGGFAAGAALGSIWGVGLQLGAGDRWGETFRVPEHGRAVVAVHGGTSLDVRDARRLLADAGAVRTYDLDRQGRRFVVSNVAELARRADRGPGG